MKISLFYWKLYGCVLGSLFYVYFVCIFLFNLQSTLLMVNAKWLSSWLNKDSWKILRITYTMYVRTKEEEQGPEREQFFNANGVWERDFALTVIRSKSFGNHQNNNAINIYLTNFRSSVKMCARNTEYNNKCLRIWWRRQDDDDE